MGKQTFEKIKPQLSFFSKTKKKKKKKCPLTRTPSPLKKTASAPKLKIWSLPRTRLTKSNKVLKPKPVTKVARRLTSNTATSLSLTPSALLKQQQQKKDKQTNQNKNIHQPHRSYK